LSEKEIKSSHHSDESLDLKNFFTPLSKGFLTIIEDIILNPINYTIGTARENVIKALDGFNNAMLLYRENPVGEMH
jgi:hypothetical protein